MKGQHEQQQLLEIERQQQQRLAEAVSYLHGRFELEAEYYCYNKGLDPLAVTPLVGARLVGASMDHMSTVLQTSRPAHPAAPTLEMVDRTHGRGAPVAAKRGPGKTAPNKVSYQVTGNRKYWDQFTPDERKKIMQKRFAKWSPKAKAKWGRGRKKGARKQPNAALYQARAKAKKNGTPVPPLPKQIAA